MQECTKQFDLNLHMNGKIFQDSFRFKMLNQTVRLIKKFSKELYMRHAHSYHVRKSLQFTRNIRIPLMMNRLITTDLLETSTFRLEL